MSRLHCALLALLAAGCADSAEEAGVTSTAPVPAPAAEMDAAAGAAVPATPAAMQLPPTLPDSTLGRRLVRTGDVGLIVDDVPAARREAAMLVRRVGGFVGAESESRYGDGLEVRLTLRVPAARFDEVMAALTSDGDAVVHRNVRVEDVTEQWVDLEARLRARRAVLDRYLQLLARAEDVSEILAVEARVAETQEAIEVAEGQLRALRDRVGLSTIELTISDDTPSALAGGPPFLRRLRDAFAVGLAGVGNLAVGIVALWPAWIILAGIALAIRAALRRRRPAQRPATAPG